MFSIKSRSTINDERPRTPPPSSDNSRNGAWGFLSAVIDSILSGNEELTECGSLKVSVVFMGERLYRRLGSSSGLRICVRCSLQVMQD